MTGTLSHRLAGPWAARTARRAAAGLALAALALGGCVGKPGEEKVTLRVGVSPELAPVMRTVVQDYSNRQPWVSVDLVQANTSRMEFNMQAGQKYDVYIPGRAKSVYAMYQNSALAPASLKTLGTNQLVIVAAAGSTLPMSYTVLTDPQVQRIAVVEPTGNHLGTLTQQALVNLRLVPVPASAPALVGSGPPPAPVNNLEAKLLPVLKEHEVLEAVRNGSAQIGITFATFAAAEPALRQLSPLPAFSYDRVVYLVGVPRNAPHYDEAWNFLNFLQSLQARSLLQRGGLVVDADVGTARAPAAPGQ